MTEFDLTKTHRGVKITAEAPHHEPEDVESALRRVAFVCLENRGELETAAGALDTFHASNTREAAAGLREILDALDDWHTASLAVMRDPAIQPEAVDALALNPR